MQKISWIRPQVILVTNCILHTLYTLVGSQFPTRVFISIVTPRIFNLREVYINIYIIINSLVKREAVKLQFFKISCLLRRKQAYQHLTSPTWPTTTPHVCQEKSRRAKRRRNWDRIPFFCEYYIVKMVDTEVVKSVIEAFDPEETKHDTTNDICLSLGQVKEEWKSFAEFNEWVLFIFWLYYQRKEIFQKQCQKTGGTLKLPRREQIKHGIRVEQPGSMTSTGWKGEKWITKK